MPDLVPIRRALLSVSDKADLIPFARLLADRGVEIISTGGTASALTQAGLPVTAIGDVTRFPEILGGRVKTLHPMIHGALLARRDDPAHARALAEHGIEPIDLACVNLYPFERTVARSGVTLEDAIEQIDIGGPTLIRAAAKNADWVTVVTHARQYDDVATELSRLHGSTSLALRRRFAADAFARTASYDRAIVAFLGKSDRAFPPILSLEYQLDEELRYGENPHQSAALYRDPASTGPTVVNAEQLHGKKLSYNNLLDAAAALELVKALRKMHGPLPRASACVVKHTNPCGAASADSPALAVAAAIAGDPAAAYGGILALDRPIDTPAAERIATPDRFFEVLIAPDYEPPALDILRDRWKNVRILAVGDRPAARQRKLEYRSIPGGMLVQDRDASPASTDAWTHAAGPAPSPTHLQAAALLVHVARALSSNAVAIGGHDPVHPGAIRLFGAGAGQMDRLAACRIAIEKAGPLANGAVAVSDAFFPFPDGPQRLIDAGVACIVHPGGSKRDDETFALCDRHAVTCLTTGVRRFRH